MALVLLVLLTLVLVLLANRKDWTLLRDDSIFVDWQRLKVQENVEEVSNKRRAGEATAVGLLVLGSCN